MLAVLFTAAQAAQKKRIIAERRATTFTAAQAAQKLTLALFVLMRTTLVVINGQMTGAPAMFMDCLQMVIPPIAPACISTYVTLWTACTVYTWQKDLLHIFAKS